MEGAAAAADACCGEERGRPLEACHVRDELIDARDRLTGSWGRVRSAVLVASLVAVVGVLLLDDPDSVERDPALWLAFGGCIGAGLAGSLRFSAVLAVASPRRGTRPPDRLRPRGEGDTPTPGRLAFRDARWSMLLVVGAFVVRSVWWVLFASADPYDLLWSLLAAMIWFAAYLVGALPGLLVVFAAISAVALVRAHRSGVAVASTSWAVPVVFAALAVFAVTSLASIVYLGAPSSRGLGGFAGLLLWDFGGLSGGGLVLAWSTRLSGLVVVSAAVVLFVGRLKASREGQQH